MPNLLRNDWKESELCIFYRKIYKFTWKLKGKIFFCLVLLRLLWFLLLFRKEHQKLQEKLKAVESKIIVGGENLVCVL